MLNISVLGGGWLGVPLGEKLKENHDVVVSYRKATTKNNIEEAGLDAWHLDLDDEDLDPDFFDADVLVIAIPPGVRADGGAAHLRHLKRIIEQLDDDTKVVYCNSTAIYSLGNDLSEEQANKNSVFYNFEQQLSGMLSDRLTVARLGGLVGGERIIVNSIINKEVKVNAKDPVNLVHLTDVVNAIVQIIDQDFWGEILNIVSPEHPSKQEVYELWSLVKEIPGEILYSDEQSSKINKTISPAKLVRDLAFEFKYKNPLHFFK